MKMLSFFLLTCSLSLCFTHQTFGQYSQVGAAIEGEAAGERFGLSLAMNASGTIFAAGAPRNGDNGTNSGEVRVYEYASGAWAQIGQDINGVNPEDRIGNILSINAAGDRIAIPSPGNSDAGYNAGHVRVFQYQSNLWNQIGQTIEGTVPDGLLGASVSLSADGTTLAVGAPHVNVNGPYGGLVKVFRLEMNQWELLGTILYGSGSGDFFGKSLDLSHDGNTIAIGDKRNEGSITIYQYDGVNWQQRGNTISSPPDHYNGADAVRISEDGYTVAGISHGFINNEGALVGLVYKFDGTFWNNVGSELRETGFVGATLNNCLDMNATGNVVAIGRYGSNAFGENSPGTTFVSQKINNDWVTVGSGIDGENADDLSGHAVSFNAVGNIIAIGSPDNDDNGESSGHVRVFITEDLSVNDPLDILDITFFPNPVNDILIISNKEQQEIESITVYTLLGQEVLTQHGNSELEISMDLKSLQTGSYLLSITTSQGIISRQLIKQ